MKNGIGIEEIMIAEMIIAHVLAPKEEIEERTEETVPVGRKLNKGKVRLKMN